MTTQEAWARLSEINKKQAAYNHALGLLSFDGVTGAPKDTADNRGETIGILSEVAYGLSTGETTCEALDTLSEHADALTETQKRVVEVMRKDLIEMRKIPMDEYLAFQKHLNESDTVWHEAKDANDYQAFAPYLEKTIAYMKRIAGYVKPEARPYEYWLDTFEQGLTMEKCERFLYPLRDRIRPLIARVCASEPIDERIARASFPIDKQRALSDTLMKILGIDRRHCAIAETEHPFTTNFTKYDVRITTHYYEDNFLSSMFSVVHEGGHALYELNTADELAYTPLGGGASMGLHESQSRFYENIIGRSLPFARLIAPTLRALCPALAGESDEAFYRAFNLSQPSLIRTEADELTYSMHILIRYELEKRLFDGSLTVSELPGAWNDLYKENLGVAVPNDREGVLQDSHWSGGMFGYFPSYALGSAYGAQMLNEMEKTVNVDEAVAAGDLTPINDWLRARVWRFGMLKKPEQLLTDVFGGAFDPEYFIAYLERKYTEIYRL